MSTETSNSTPGSPIGSVTDRPLQGLRIVDLADGKGDLCGRLFADLGAEVIRVEPPEGAAARLLPPILGEHSLWFGYRNAGKRSVVLDRTDAADAERFQQLLATADVCIDSSGPSGAAGVTAADLAAAHPHLIVLSMSDFGLTGPYADYVGTDSVLHALAGMVFKAGIPSREPLLPPGTIAYDAASVTAAFAVLCALIQGAPTGAGQLIDFSVLQAVAQLADWSMINASATINAGSIPGEVRNGSGPVYAIFPCKTGYVRLVILSPRQWKSMLEWLGNPDYLQDPELESFLGRFSIADAVLNPLYEELFSTMSMQEVAVEAQRRGIVCTPVLTADDVMANEHFESRGTFVPLPVVDGADVSARFASGFFELDGVRQGPQRPAPALGVDTDAVFADLGPANPPPTGPLEPALPLAGMRVMDFGHGGVGVEAGRMLAEYGAEVLKIESVAYVDFIRVVLGGFMSPSFASSSRSKKGFAANAKTEGGRNVLLDIAKISDIVIENNSTGTMDQMNMGFAAFREANPRIVMVSSQLLGSRGAWSHWKGYGPNSQPVGGLVDLWDYAPNEDGSRDGPAGSGSIFPDHLAGRMCAVAALAGVVGRNRHGLGTLAEVAQIEMVTGVLGDLLAKAGAEPGSVQPQGNRRDRGAPWGMYPCAGDEQWVAISVESDEQWQALVGVLGSPDWATDSALASAAGRHAAADLIDEKLGAWTSGHDHYDVQANLQAAGVPAGVMLTGAGQLSDPHLVARGYVVEVEQPPIGPLHFEGPAFTATAMASAFIGPAPVMGGDTVAFCRDVLGMPQDEIDALIADGSLELPPV
ncbi:MAG: hypothetical protein HKN26_15350 [Acidimicrobiales bacterium]|nr:hypothetical protein [Acidimicrobiales bacterium]